MKIREKLIINSKKSKNLANLKQISKVRYEIMSCKTSYNRELKGWEEGTFKNGNILFLRKESQKRNKQISKL